MWEGLMWWEEEGEDLEEAGKEGGGRWRKGKCGSIVEETPYEI